MVKIDYLADVTDCIPSLAAWLMEAFDRNNPNATLESRIETLQGRLVRGQLPVTFVARMGKEIVGSASLVQFDMDSRTELEPWLSAVFVRPQFRRHGVGTKLVQRAEQEVLTLGYERLFLYTPDMQAFYASFGWLHLEDTAYRGRPVTIMHKHLT